MKRFTLKSVWTPWLVFLIGVLVYKYLFGMEGVFAFFEKLGGILRPFVWGFAIAYIINIPAEKISGLIKKYTPLKEKSKIAAVAVTYALFILVFVLAATLLFPVLQDSIAELAKNAPEYYARLKLFLQQWDYIGMNEYINKMLASLQSLLSFSNIGSYIKNIADFTGNIADVFISVIVSVYSSVSSGHIKEKLKIIGENLIPHEMNEKIRRYAGIADGVFSKYIASQGIDALVVMILSVAVMGIMRVKYALILGIIIGVFNMIPYIGAFISIFSAVLLTFITGGMSQAVWLLVLLIVLQQLDANFISVKIVGESLNLNPLEVIFAIAVGGGFFGAAGMLFAVPFFASAKDILTDILKHRINTGENIAADSAVNTINTDEN